MSRTENAYIASMVKVKTLFSIYYTHTTDFSDNTTCNTLLRYEPSRTLFSIAFPIKCTSFGVILRYHATTNLVWCVFHPFPCTWVQLCWSSIGIDLQWKRRWNHFSLKELMVVKISRCGLIIQLQRTVFRLLTPKKNDFLVCIFLKYIFFRVTFVTQVDEPTLTFRPRISI